MCRSAQYHDVLSFVHHAQSGEFTRVLTSPFVHQSPWALIVALLALGYMAADVEAYVR